MPKVPQCHVERDTSLDLLFVCALVAEVAAGSRCTGARVANIIGARLAAGGTGGV